MWYRIGNEIWCKYEFCIPFETCIGSALACKFLRFVSQDFKVRCVRTFVDQIHILCYDILCEKTWLFFFISNHYWSWANQNKIFIFPQILRLLPFLKHFALSITSFSLWEVPFWECSFSNEHWIQAAFSNWKAACYR